MNLHRTDVAAIAGYIAGGGLAGLFVFAGQLWPEYQAQANGIALAIVAVAGLIRTIANPTPASGQQAVTQPIPPTLPTPPKGP